MFGRGLVRRLGVWALVQALPDEAALKAYLRAAYLGLSGIIIGSVMAGAALSAGLVALYHFMVESNIDQTTALATTALSCLILILGCFYLSGVWFQKFISLKQHMSIVKDQNPDFLGGAFNSVAEGFLEGFMSNAESRHRQSGSEELSGEDADEDNMTDDHENVSVFRKQRS